MISFKTLVIVPLILVGCNYSSPDLSIANIETVVQQDSIKIEEESEWQYDNNYIANSFDFPVGKPDGKGYYNAQGFTKNNHLGEDWNGNDGGNTDLGDPVYCIGSGYVKFAQDEGGGWGNVIRIIHKLPNGELIESLYAHCDTILVTEDSWIIKGTQIGTIGTANGAYIAHLHLEIRDIIDQPLGGGYSGNTYGYVNPTEFIEAHR